MTTPHTLDINFSLPVSAPVNQKGLCNWRASAVLVMVLCCYKKSCWLVTVEIQVEELYLELRLSVKSTSWIGFLTCAYATTFCYRDTPYSVRKLSHCLVWKRASFHPSRGQPHSAVGVWREAQWPTHRLCGAPQPLWPCQCRAVCATGLIWVITSLFTALLCPVTSPPESASNWSYF